MHETKDRSRVVIFANVLHDRRRLHGVLVWWKGIHPTQLTLNRSRPVFSSSSFVLSQLSPLLAALSHVIFSNNQQQGRFPHDGSLRRHQRWRRER
jgi:hypothetical protein